jgi:hypothetical protein
MRYGCDGMALCLEFRRESEDRAEDQRWKNTDLMPSTTVILAWRIGGYGLDRSAPGAGYALDRFAGETAEENRNACNERGLIRMTVVVRSSRTDQKREQARAPEVLWLCCVVYPVFRTVCIAHMVYFGPMNVVLHFSESKRVFISWLRALMRVALN